jgi:hypothetical protein
MASGGLLIDRHYGCWRSRKQAANGKRLFARGSAQHCCLTGREANSIVCADIR